MRDGGGVRGLRGLRGLMSRGLISRFWRRDAVPGANTVIGTLFEEAL